MLTFKLNQNLFLRDPQSTPLGQNIISKSVEMIENLGFEHFTFKKLADEIGSTEASIYRYFENKHRLLLYLIDWYWTWLEYKIDFHINNVQDATERLKICLVKISEQKIPDPNVAYLDEQALERIVSAEFEKTFLTKQVDADNKEGLFLPYKSLCKKVASVIREVNPKYEFSHSLASTVLLLVKQQLYYAQHLPSLSDIKYNATKQDKKLYVFLESLVFKTIGK